MFPVTLDGLQVVRGVGLGDFYHGVCGIHRRLSDFIHAIVVHRRDEAIRGWRNWIREDPLVHPYKWLRPDLVPPAPFLQCEPHLSPGGSGVLSDPSRIDEEFRKAWLPYFCRSGQREASLEEFDDEVLGWLPFFLRFLSLQPRRRARREPASTSVSGRWQAGEGGAALCGGSW